MPAPVKNLAIMNPPFRIPLTVLALTSAFSIAHVFAEPIDYSEVSLLVRAHESETSITQEVSRRKLVHALTPQQETTLKSQGASDSLVQTLRRSDVALSAADASAFETRRDQNRQAQKAARAVSDETSSDRDSGNVHVFNVAFGQPLNLSQWGGLDYEIAFYSYRFAGEDYIEPIM